MKKRTVTRDHDDDNWRDIGGGVQQRRRGYAPIANGLQPCRLNQGDRQTETPRMGSDMPYEPNSGAATRSSGSGKVHEAAWTVTSNRARRKSTAARDEKGKRDE